MAFLGRLTRGYNSSMIPVIICGGTGSKMWPLSSPRMPKQFLPLIHGKSLFEINWDMLRQRYQPEEIFLQTNREQAKIALELVPEIAKDNVFIEPESRNQGPATGLIAALLKKRGIGEEMFFLVQVDDIRTPTQAVFDMMDVAEKIGRETGKYVTGGFQPDRIVGGVDYLLKGKLLREENGVKVYEVADYIDRSDEAKIAKYLNSGKLLLHTNHTTMTPNNMLALIKKYKPEWSEHLNNIVKGKDVNIEFPLIPKGTLEEITVELHKKGESIVIENPFKWTDFGTWESLEKYYRENEISPINGGTTEIYSKGNFCLSESKKKVAIIGFDNVIVIEGKDGILVCKKDLSGKVGEVV